MKCYNKTHVFIHDNRMLAERAFYCNQHGFKRENEEADT